MVCVQYMIEGDLALYECPCYEEHTYFGVCVCFHKGHIQRGILVLMIKKIKPPKSNWS